MNLNKILIGGVAGGVAMFLLGWLFYGILLADMMAAETADSASMMKEMPDMLPLIIGNLSWGFLLAYIFNKWASIDTLVSGAKGGAVVGFLIAVGFDTIFYATTTMYTPKLMAIDIVVSTFMFTVAGGVVGYALGMGKK
jgi:hypothetical protein